MNSVPFFFLAGAVMRICVLSAIVLLHQPSNSARENIVTNSTTSLSRTESLTTHEKHHSRQGQRYLSFKDRFYICHLTQRYLSKEMIESANGGLTLVASYCMYRK